MSTWADVKQTLQDYYPSMVGSNLFVDPDTGELAGYARQANNWIASYPHPFTFLKDTYNLTLTGAASYNLRTLIPDIVKVQQITGIDQYQESYPLSDNEGRLTSGPGHYLRNLTLYFPGTTPASGTAIIDYKSKYLVQDAVSGLRKLDFEDDADISLIPEEYIPVYCALIGLFIEARETGTKRKSLVEISRLARSIIGEMMVIPDGEQSGTLKSFLE